MCYCSYVFISMVLCWLSKNSPFLMHKLFNMHGYSVDCWSADSIALQEYWCKRLHPKYVCERVFRQPPLKESLKKGRLKKQDHTVTKQKASLLRAADLIGQKIQYNCPGFLPNKRQVTLPLSSSLLNFCVISISTTSAYL